VKYFWFRYRTLDPARTLLSCAAVLLCIAVLAIVIGCDKAERHKILTFFFDGVPPLSFEYLDPNSPDYAEQLKKLEQASRGSSHNTGKECFTVCHDKSGIHFKPVPELCYTCHDDYSKQGVYVHAPVLVGDCLFCHREHESRNRFLMRYSIPTLCFKCHDKDAVALIENHNNEEYNLCTGCHSGHATSNKHLLKGGVRLPNLSQKKKTGSPEIVDPNTMQENKNESVDNGQQQLIK
jgi:predicted CXXCH cytochrome family protein